MAKALKAGFHRVADRGLPFPVMSRTGCSSCWVLHLTSTTSVWGTRLGITEALSHIPSATGKFWFEWRSLTPLLSYESKSGLHASKE